MKLHCYSCYKPVSSDVPEETFVRAYLECPECIEEKAAKAVARMERIMERYDTAFDEKCCATLYDGEWDRDEATLFFWMQAWRNAILEMVG
jgi:hypothetical protein